MKAKLFEIIGKAAIKLFFVYFRLIPHVEREKILVALDGFVKDIQRKAVEGEGKG